MLRYALYEKEKLVPLTKEIDYIRDFILIQNYRQKDGVQLQFDFPETDEAIFIAPFIFITFIENAFKHGVLNDPDFPIRIEFTYTDNKLHFNCRNKNRKQKKDAQGGLGLDNTKRRLELIYGDKQQLKIDQKDSSFNVELTLDLK
ncbi:MAG: hypothetical protein KDD94_06020, partial [Calditrichaeota bacterium]|nr:hypothetical protein [Calditrichota bacterium]